MRSCPPTSPVRLENTRTLLRVRALAICRSAPFSSFFPRRFSLLAVFIQAVTSSTFVWAYQTSMVPILADSLIRSRY